MWSFNFRAFIGSKLLNHRALGIAPIQFFAQGDKIYSCAKYKKNSQKEIFRTLCAGSFDRSASEKIFFLTSNEKMSVKLVLPYYREFYGITEKDIKCWVNTVFFILKWLPKVKNRVKNLKF